MKRFRKPGVSILETTMALAVVSVAVVAAAQLVAMGHRARSTSMQRVAANQELDNALETALRATGPLGDDTLRAIAARIAAEAHAAGSAPDEFALNLKTADDPNLPAGTQRVDGTASYRDRATGLLVELPVVSIWKFAANEEPSP